MTPTAPAPSPAASAPPASATGGGTIQLAQAAPPGPAGVVPPPGPPTATPLGGRIEVPPPAPGQRSELKVLAGMRVQLPDPAFLPPQAKYLVQGDDLVVETAQGGVLVLQDFFAVPNVTLSVVGRPPVTNAFLFEAAVVDPAGQTVIPAAPPTGPQPATQGNASFSPYDPGDIGVGIPVTGPLGPTELLRAVAFELRRATPEPAGEEEGPQPPAPENDPPTVTLLARVVGTVVADPVGFNYPGNAPMPGVAEGRAIDEAAVNGLPPGFVTLDTARTVEVVFSSEIAGLVNALGVVEVRPDGRLVNPRIVFPKVNSFDTSYPFQDGSGPLRPGDRFDLGEIPAGTTIGLFLIQQGGKIPGLDLSTGRIEIRDPATGGPADLDTLSGPPRVVHVAPNGTETVLPVVFHTLDPTPGTPNANPLNPDGLGHVVSGYDNASGDVVLSFEDLRGTLGTSTPVPFTNDPANPGNPWKGRADRDFNDAAFALRFGEVSLGDVLFLGERRAIIEAAISDPEGDRIGSASLRIASGARPGDLLGLVASADANGDGVVDGTNIRVVKVSATELRFDGIDTPDNYVRALGAVTLSSSTGTILAGERTFALTVTDERGAQSAPATTVLEVNEDRVVLGDGDDTYVGTDGAEAVFGGRGDDRIFGAGGRDLLIGGSGNDELNGGDGDDVLIGLGGNDRLVGGAGADRFVYTALSDGFDVVVDFNSAQGDRLDFEKFFRGTGFDPRAADASQWLRFTTIDFDGSGGLNDVRVEVDRDGPGSAYGFSTAFVVLNQLVPGLVNIENATTYGHGTA
ncbi:MAG: type I secretion C-terminal target domain-containing protein [Geminicoccaceae bacterium]|nr:type I secretion C-terminal target domain-containing protein [Geminicoccaceae bacterium]MDW8125841.1 type I secretion C-terminal target domain-containing protein [Geminicoccaceae bacterium]MDW8340316.1 type I secretion C-terminal target domain-containing protein [Geminicoccaceae bacterium]